MVAVDHRIACQHTQQYRHSLSITKHAEELGGMRRRPTMVGLVISQSILKKRDQAGNARAASSQNLSLYRFWHLTVPLPQLLHQRRSRCGVVDVVWRITKAHEALLVADLPIEGHAYWSHRHEVIESSSLPIASASSRRSVQSLIFGQNPKIGYQEFNDLQTPQLSKKQL